MLMQLDSFQIRVLRALVNEFAKLSENEKAVGGVDTRIVAKTLAADLGKDSTFVDGPEYHGSELFLKVLNTVTSLEELHLIKATRFIGGHGWASATPSGRELLLRLDSPPELGQQIVRQLYRLQQDVPEARRRVGKAPFDPQEFATKLGLDVPTVLRAMRWAQRAGFLADLIFDQATLENGDVYITDAGMNAVDNDFEQGQVVSGGPTINIHDSKVYGNILAAGRDAMSVGSPGLSNYEDEILDLLSKIQEAVESLPEPSDERHDALQELESLQRELSKDTPAPERAERSLNLLGSLASIGGVVAPHVMRLMELVHQIPH